MGGMNLEKLWTGKRLPWVVAAAVAFYLTVMAVALSWPDNEKGGWKILRKVDPITDVETVELILPSEGEYKLLGEKYRAAMIVTLRGEKGSDARIVLPFAPESGDELICRWDAEPPVKGGWRIDEETKSVIHFTADFEDVLAWVAEKHRLVVRGTGFPDPVDVVFNLDGFAAALKDAGGAK